MNGENALIRIVDDDDDVRSALGARGDARV